MLSNWPLLVASPLILENQNFAPLFPALLLGVQVIYLRTYNLSL